VDATDALDVSKESKETLAMYGVGEQPTDSYARRCVMARRLVERGVRFVQIYINAQIWDNHSQIEGNLRTACERTDKPVAALLQDLKQRGLLSKTLKRDRRGTRSHSTRLQPVDGRRRSQARHYLGQH
jgi:hypothetical protein